MRYSHRTGDVKRKSRGQLCRGPTPSIAQRTRACPAGRGRDLIRAVALGVAPSRRTVTDVMSSSGTSAELERLPPRFLGVAQSTGSERPRSIPAIGRRDPDRKKVLPPTMPVGTSGGRTFAEPITLPSTDRIDFRLPATALTIGFDLLASRTRRRQETTARQSEFQGGSRANDEEVLAICNLFFFPHFHSYPCNLWITSPR